MLSNHLPSEVICTLYNGWLFKTNLTVDTSLLPPAFKYKINHARKKRKVNSKIKRKQRKLWEN